MLFMAQTAGLILAISEILQKLQNMGGGRLLRSKKAADVYCYVSGS